MTLFVCRKLSEKFSPVLCGRLGQTPPLPDHFGADGLFRRERGDDFFEPRVAAERVPEGQQF